MGQTNVTVTTYSSSKMDCCPVCIPPRYETQEVTSDMKLGAVFDLIKAAHNLTKPGFDVDSTGKSLYMPKVTSEDRLEMTLQQLKDDNKLKFNKDDKCRLFTVDSSVKGKLYVDLVLK